MRGLNIAIFMFAFVLSSLAAGTMSAQASGPTTLARTAWQVFATPTYVSDPDHTFQHGAIGEYAAAPAIPSASDAGWQPCGAASPIRFSPYFGSIPLCPNANTIGMGVGSRLPDCFGHLDFTFFQSFVSVPLNTVISQFSINMQGADDGARVSIVNSNYPNGLVLSGSYIFLGGSQSTTNLATYVVPGEVNRVVVTQVDDCAVANNLGYAAITLNGSVVVVADTDLSISHVSDITTQATSPSGATVAFPMPTATDGPNAVAVSCDHASSSTFSIGATTVTCSATDLDDTPSTVSTSFVVNVTRIPTTTTVSFGSGPFVYSGSAFTATASVSPAGTATVTYSGDCVNAGNTCTATAAFDGDATYLPSSATASITIDKAPSSTTVSFGPGPFIFTGTAFTATATVSPSGTATIAYSGDCVNPGTSCTATATFAGDANHTGSSATAGITITYTLCAPSSSAAKNAANPGSTIPVKIRVCDANGNNIGSAALQVQAISITPSATLDDSGKANPGNLFRFSPDDGIYIYNLSTKGIPSGAYTLDFTIGNDPTTYHVALGVR